MCVCTCARARTCVCNVSNMMENILEISFLLPSCMWVPGIKLVIRFDSECFYPLNQLFPFNFSRMFLIYLLAFWECSKLLLHPCVSHSVPNSTDLTAICLTEAQSERTATLVQMTDSWVRWDSGIFVTEEGQPSFYPELFEIILFCLS